MKDVKKIKFLIREECNPKDTWIYKIVSKKYMVEFSDDPDYIICQCYDKTMKYLNYKGIRIFTTGENYIPDFNLVDYAICNYPIQLYDRCLRFPQCASGYMGDRKALEKRKNFFGIEDLKRKTRFANFIYSHESWGGVRRKYFKELCKYKRVDSAGTYLNNMPDGKNVRLEDGSKSQLQMSSKFTIAIESNVHEGFVTEKITDAFFAETIPIYYGDPYADEIFNPKAYINCSRYKDMNEVIERVRYLDSHDEEYMAMINEPVFRDENYLSNIKKQYEEFVEHIFSQPVEQAYRRGLFGYPRVYNDYFRRAGNIIRPIEKNRLFGTALKLTYKLRHPELYFDNKDI